ncbi:MAG: TlpA family protein disulfide reductase [Magnetococcales bacterium]|nr:TlpA family protein disulfide reductase [Magnetococcales bacterium]
MVVGLVLSGCGGEKRTLLEVGSQAPPFTLKLVDGKTTWNMADHAGKPMVITFMASWCPCSHDSIPLTKEAHGRFSDRGVEFLMVGLQDAESKFEDFVAKQAPPFPAGFDDGEPISRTYGVSAPPTTVFIGKDGLVKRIFYGNIKDVVEDYYLWIEELVA